MSESVFRIVVVGYELYTRLRTEVPVLDGQRLLKARIDSAT